MTLEQFFDDIYLPKKLLGKSANTIRLYRVFFRNLTKTLGRTPLVSDLTDETIQQHMERLLRNGRSKATCNKERCEFVALWRYAAQRKMVDGWPDTPKFVEPQRTPRAWMVEDVVKLLQAVSRIESSVGDVPGSIFWRGLLLTAFDTAERIGALMCCEWSWLEEDELLIRGEARKGGKRDKWFKLSPQTVETLQQIRKYNTQPKIFHWPYSYTYLWRKYKGILESAELPTGRRCGFHRIRKTTASVVYKSGMDPQDTLDHSDRRTTQRYLDPRYTRQRQACDALAEFLGNPQGDRRKGNDRRKTG